MLSESDIVKRYLVVLMLRKNDHYTSLLMEYTMSFADVKIEKKKDILYCFCGEAVLARTYLNEGESRQLPGNGAIGKTFLFRKHGRVFIGNEKHQE